MQDPAPAVPDAPATSATPNEQPAAQPTSQPTPQPAAEQPVAEQSSGTTTPSAPTLTKEQIDEYNAYKAYMDSHGGFDKLKKLADARTEQLQKMVEQVNPQTTSQPVPQPSAQPTAQSPVQLQPSTASAQPPKGYLSREELEMRRYYQDLAAEPKYAPIAKEILDGTAIKEMSELGIYPTDQNGFVNDANVRKFLDLKAQTVPAQQTSVEPSTTPTVDYVNVGEEITTLDEAQKIIFQNEKLRASGQAEHPSTAKAKEFLKQYLNSPNRTAQ